MSESLSIEEILKQAESVRKKAEKTVHVTHSYDETAEIPIKAEHQNQADAVNGSTKVIPKVNTADQKTRSVKIEEKTGVVPDIKNVKKSYFNTGASEEEAIYSRRPPEMVERPATIKSKSSFNRTSDLEDMPTIVAVEELENTRLNFGSNSASRNPSSYESDESDQIVLEGFEDTFDKVEKIDERVAEEQLAKKRSEKINKFRLFSPDEVDNEESGSKTVKNDYKNNSEKTLFLEKLFSAKSSVTFVIAVTLVLAIPLGLLTAFKDSVHIPQFLLDDTAYFTTLVINFALIILINIKTIVHGFNFKNGINSDLPISIASLITFIHTLMMAVNTDLYIDSGSAFAFVIAFALLMSNIGKRTMLTRIIDNFEFLTNHEGNLHTVEAIANSIDAAIISRGVLTGEANLKTSIKTDFSTKFLDIACSDEPADNIAKITGMTAFGLNVAAFAVFSIINQNWHFGLNAAVCGLCISLPCISLYCTNKALLGMSDRLRENGAMINGFEGARTANNTNAIVIEAQDLFGRTSCSIHGKKCFNKARQDEVVLYTAAVITQTKSPLSYVFDQYIVGKDTIVPEVDGVIYEDKLGTSAWLYRKKILVGTRELMLHHGVQVLTEEYEKRYTKKGRKVLYLAVAGKLMAMFVVSYSADPNLKRALRRLEKSGMTVLVKSSDPYITDESIAEMFNLPEGFIRVISSSNARTFEKYSDQCVETSPAYIVHDGSALGFVSAMDAAENLEETRKLLSVLISFGSIIGLGVTLLLGFMGGLTQLNAINITVFQFLWCILVRIVSIIKRSI